MYSTECRCKRLRLLFTEIAEEEAAGQGNVAHASNPRLENRRIGFSLPDDEALVYFKLHGPIPSIVEAFSRGRLPVLETAL